MNQTNTKTLANGGVIPDVSDTPVIRTRRITGYLSSKSSERWNGAKQAELRDRVKHGATTVSSEAGFKSLNELV
jgi:hypothetical protein